MRRQRYTITRITLGQRDLMRDVETSWVVDFPQDWTAWQRDLDRKKAR